MEMIGMQLGFNQATTLENSNLEKDLELCNKHGFDFIEIRTMDKLPEYMASHSLEELIEYFQTHHIKPMSFNVLLFFNNRNKADHNEVIEEFKKMMELGKRLGVQYVVAVPLVTKEKILKRDIQNSCIEVLTELSDIAKPYGIKIAVEFIGHPECTVNTFAQGYAIVQRVNRENVGLVLDCFHFHAMGSNIEDLKKADGSKIFLLHMDDTEDFPIGFLTDEDRVWPGSGVIDLDGILSTLQDIGFSGPASVELFRPEYYQLETEEVIKTAKETTAKVLSRYFELETTETV